MKFTKRLLPLLTAATLLLLMAACGNQGSGSTGDTDSGGGGESAYHYVPSDIELPAGLTDFYSSSYSDGKLYLAGSNESGNPIIYVVDTETGDYEEIPCNGSSSSYINALYPDGQCGVYFAQTTYPEAGAPEDAIEDSASSDESDAPVTDEDAEASSASFSATAPETKLYHLNSDGTITAEADLSESMQDDYITSVLIDSGGIIYACGYSKIAVLDRSLSLINTITPDGSGVSGIALSSKGDIITALYGSDKLYTVDAEAGELTEICAIKSGDYISLINGGDKDIYYYDNNGVCGVDLSSGESEQLIKWLDCDIVGYGVSEVYRTGADFIVNTGMGAGFVVNGGSDSESSTNSAYLGQSGFTKLTRTEGSALTDKIVLEFAALYLSSDMQTAITGFNRTSDKYRINVTDYSQYNTDDDEAGLTKLNTEIIAGNVPDIIDLTGLSAEKYINLGLLTDLYELMDNDSEINRDDFMTNILSALETGEKLYQIVPSYGISTVVGRTDDVGSDMGWTLSEYEALMAGQEENVSSFANMTSSDYLSKMLEVSADSFIDWDTGTCSFDSDAFIELLEAAAKYPREVDETDPGYVDSLVQLYNGTAILDASELYSEFSIQMYEALLGGEITYIGYPTSDGKGGNSILPSSTLGISDSSENKDGAWEFLKYILSDNFQSSITDGFPLRSFSLYTKLSSFLSSDDESAMIGIYTDSGPITIELTSLPEEAIEKLTKLIASTDAVSRTDYTLSDIVLEEAGSYFSGSKTAEAAAKVIQDRISTYISEQS